MANTISVVGGQFVAKTPTPQPIPAPADTAMLTFGILNSTKPASDSFTVLADLNTGRPAVTAGGAKWPVTDRPQRAGLTFFGGYDPLQLTVPILFDNFRAGTTIQDDVALLWRMWGRGPKAANSTASKTPPVIEITGALLPSIVQFSEDNQGPPNWTVVGVDEDSASALFNSAQNLVRLPVVVTLQEYITTSALSSLAPAATTAKTQTTVYPKDTTMRQVATRQHSTVVALRTLNHYGTNKTLDSYLRDPSRKFLKSLSVKVPTVPA